MELSGYNVCHNSIPKSLGEEALNIVIFLFCFVLTFEILCYFLVRQAYHNIAYILEREEDGQYS